MKTTFIYALCEPLTGEIRYVGKANSPKKRLLKHLRDSAKHLTHLGNWLRMLGTLRISPVLEILDEIPESQWQFWEREYIRVFRAIGMDLVNTTEGGDGVTQTPEVREKIGAALKGKSFTPSHLAATQAAGKRRLGIAPPNKGVPMSEKQKDFLRGLTGEKSPHFGKKRSDETKAKMTAAQLGHVCSEKARANMSAAKQGSLNNRFGTRHSKETKARMSASARARRKDANV